MGVDGRKANPVWSKAAKAGVLVAGVVGTAVPAHAQFWGGWFGSRPEPVEPVGVVPPRVVASVLHRQGYRLVDPPSRRGDRIIAIGVDDTGQVMRFVLDAQDGAVIHTALVGAPRPPGYIGRGDAYAYGDPALPGDPYVIPGDAPPPKAKKPKTRTAAKPPSPLPGAAPASPAAPPSEATQTPPTIAPAPAAPAPVVAPPPTASAPVPPVAAPAPTAAPAAAPPPVAAVPVRPATDAQPADIGPKVVPVRPSEARAPDTTPPAALAPSATPPAAPATPAQ